MTDADALSRQFMLALCVWREARGESPAGKRFVAQVILNRARDAQRRWPRTVVGVITQPEQFSAFNKSDPNVTRYPSEADQSWAESVLAVDQVFASTVPFTSANHYHAIGSKPNWADASKIVAREDHHVFYCL